MINQIHAIDDVGVLKSTICKLYVEDIEPRHRPHSRRKILQALYLTCEATNNEVKDIIEEREANVGKAFITVDSDFVWVPDLKASYGCITINLIVKRHVFTDGRAYFSKFTAKECQDIGFLAYPKPSSNLMDFCIAFEEFTEDHTGENIFMWLEKYLNFFYQSIIPLSPDN